MSIQESYIQSAVDETKCCGVMDEMDSLIRGRGGR